MQRFSIQNEKDFMSLQAGDVISIGAFGSVLIDKLSVILEPTRSGNIPKVLLKSLMNTSEPLPRFIHWYENKLVDDGFKPIIQDNSLSLTVETIRNETN